MESILPFIGVAAFALICPLMMVAIGGVGWLVARARGQKGSFSSCMTGHGGHHQAAATDKADLSEEVARLQTELDALKSRRHDGAPVVINIAADGSIPTVSGLLLEQQV